MIHYHGTRVSGPTTEAHKFLAGRHALIPFTDPDNLEVAAEVCKSFVFDNGAFTVWRKGGTLDLDGYYSWVEAWNNHPAFAWSIIPDVIEGSEDDNDRLLEQWPAHLRGIPVWHLHESIDRLNRLATNYDTIALGSSGKWSTPGERNWWGRMAEAMDAVCDSNGFPICKLHGLRMLNPKVFSELPLASADSCNAAINAGSVSRFGMYTPINAAQRANIIADRIEAVNGASRWRPAQQFDLIQEG